MKKLVSIILAVAIFSSMSAFAMSTSEFDNGMRKGIDYFNRGMYYEARDEFQWFCDYNWGKMNSGQQQYALDYLDGAKAKIANLSVNEIDIINLVRKSYYTHDDEVYYGIQYACIDKGNYYEVISKVTRNADGGTLFYVSKNDYDITELGSGSELLFDYEWVSWHSYSSL